MILIDFFLFFFERRKFNIIELFFILALLKVNSQESQTETKVYYLMTRIPIFSYYIFKFGQCLNVQEIWTMYHKINIYPNFAFVMYIYNRFECNPRFFTSYVFIY